MNVKRYYVGLSSPLQEDTSGDIVKFEDYEKLYDALYRIHNYPEEDSLWDDDRDDAAWEIVEIAGRALNLTH
jgi:hypothetical protein